MGRIYSLGAKTASITAAKTLMLIENPAATVLLLRGAHVVAPDNDTNEQLDLVLQRGNVIGTPTGTGVTPAPHSQGDSASGVTATADLTVEPTSYTASTEIAFRGGSSLGGYHYDPPEKEMAEVSPSEFWGLRMLTAMGSAKILSVDVIIEELGG